MKVFIGLGSNLGDRRRTIEHALELLNATQGVRVTRVSALIETDPVGGPRQGKYLNGVAKLETVLSPENLLGALQSIEKQLGRERRVRHGPRTIDLDFLLYGEQLIETPELRVPHPRMQNRDFVMNPLREIEPMIDEILANVQRQTR